MKKRKEKKIKHVLLSKSKKKKLQANLLTMINKRSHEHTMINDKKKN
jgi:hypothetical protein